MKRVWIAVTVVLGICTFGGCGAQGPQGDTLIVYGPPNDTVQWQAEPTLAPCFRGTQVDAAVVPSIPVGPNGLVKVGTFYNFEDDTIYTIASTAGPTACLGTSGTATPNCDQTLDLYCYPPASGAAQGTFTVSGQDDAVCYHSMSDIQSGPCPPGNDGKTIYNTGVVSVTFDGQTISASYGQTSTAPGLATQMAVALDQNSTLNSQFISAANGPVGIVHALSAGTQYDYSWTTSCSYNKLWFHWCSFTVGLSPAGSLQPPQ